MTDTTPFPEVGPPVDLVKWPMAEPPTPERSVTHGRTRAEILDWVGDDPVRAQLVIREESDKFDDADVELLWACHRVQFPQEG